MASFCQVISHGWHHTDSLQFPFTVRSLSSILLIDCGIDLIKCIYGLVTKKRQAETLFSVCNRNLTGLEWLWNRGELQLAARAADLGVIQGRVQTAAAVAKGSSTLSFRFKTRVGENAKSIGCALHRNSVFFFQQFVLFPFNDLMIIVITTRGITETNSGRSSWRVESRKGRPAEQIRVMAPEPQESNAALH